ncbi:hypothetical protein BH11MYX1_BH11MYX1_41590 [soil metagenome]
MNVLELPTDRPRGSAAFPIDRSTAVGIEAPGDEATLLAAWAAVLSRLSNQDAIEIATPDGLFELDLAGTPTARELIRRASVPGRRAGARVALVRDLPWPSDHELVFAMRGRALHYASALYDAATIERHARYLRAMFEAIVEDPDVVIAQVEVVPAAERTLLVETWNQTAGPTSRIALHERFAQQAQRTPDALAVIDGARELTYAELDARANQLAHTLIARGGAIGDRVVTVLERSAELVIAQLAILKAGAVYVPIDPQTPDARQAWVIADCRARLVIDHNTVSQGPSTDPCVEASNDRAAYVMYTSGSTGTPKGVVVPHRTIPRLLVANRYLELLATDRVAWVGNPAFDISTFEVWAPLVTGGCLVVASRDDVLHSSGLRTLVRERGVTVLHLTAGLFHQIVDAFGDTFAQLRVFLFGGDAIDARVVRQVVRRAKPPHMLHCYGPTESTTFATTYEVTDVPDDAVRLPIGRPIAKTRVYVLDGTGRIAPLGAIGELFIGGGGVALGYLDRDELTAERFVHDPFDPADPHGRMYKTGDLARYLPDGNLEFLGRNDQQVKILGYRVELGEIEARLAEHAAVRDAVVVVREDVAGEKRLVAYVVPTPRREPPTWPSTGALREHLRATLPDYMIPSAFVRLDGLPLTPNGKLDRDALPAPSDEAVVRRAYEAPRGEIEETLAGLWAELLGLERVGRNDHFFELGGHSLLAVRLMDRLRRAGLGTEARTLFASPTLAALAATLGNHHDVIVPANAIRPNATMITPDQLPLISLDATEIEQIVARVPGGVANIQDIYALSPLQDGMLFHYLLERESDPYLLVEQMVFVDRSLLDRYLGAVQQVVDRHDVLRTGFVWEGLSKPAQVVWRTASLVVSEVELEATSGAAGRAELAARFDPRRYRMDLTQAPLVRFVIAREPGTERWLVLEISHHLILDNETMAILQDEVVALIAGRGHELRAPQPFRNLVAQTRLGQSADDNERFFRGLLGDIDEPTTPFGLSEVHRNGRGVTVAHRSVTSDLNDRLRAQARRLGVSLASLCHVAWGQVVARTSGREHVVFGTVLLGRMHADAERAMGLYINTLPVRLDLDETGVEACVRKTHTLLGELLRHEHASLAQVQRCSGVPAPAPLFSSLLNYRHSRPLSVGEALPGLERFGQDEGRTNYPFDLSVDDLGVGLRLTAHVADPVSPDRICGYMERALEQLAEALAHTPTQPVCALDILPPAERQQLLVAWNQTEVEFPDRCLHELFEAQVDRTPDAVVVAFEDQRLTYRELDTRANAVAHVLIAAGVAPTSIVAVIQDRSINLIVAIVAVLKAGGAYLPIEPDVPAVRVRYMLANSAAATVLTTTAYVAANAAVFDHVQVIAIDALLEDANAGRPGRRAEPRDLAYVIYTSGSTGQPKGVLVEHRSVVHFVTAEQEKFAICDTDALILLSSYSFDASVDQIWLALSSGAKLVVVDQQVLLDPGALARVITALRVTHIDTVPALLGELSPGLPSVRQVVVGGESCPPALARAWMRTTRFWNEYGPTETTVAALRYLVDPDVELADTVPIGRPIGRARAYILGRDGEPVPLGARGELYIGGCGVARGYVGTPTTTADRFLPDPFSSEAGARMYRTGDFARWRLDANIEFLGRIDHQIKIRGFRIELAEIEAALAQHPSVDQVVVAAREDSRGVKRLVAYVVRNHAELVPSKLRTYLESQLPEYMVPTAFVWLDALPVTANGKVDRVALPTPGEHAYQRAAYVAPGTRTQQVLATIWREVLGVERVGIHDSFFALGGHSLLVIRLVARISREQAIELRPGTVFESPTIAAQAALIDAQTRASRTTEDASDERELVELVAMLPESDVAVQLAEWSQVQLEPLPTRSPNELTGSRRALLELWVAQHKIDSNPTQALAPRTRLTTQATFEQRMNWDFHQRGNFPALCNQACAFAIHGHLDVPALRHAIDALLGRQPTLRSTFALHRGQLVQTIEPRGASLDVVDLSNHSPDQREARVRQLFEVISRPHELGREVFRSQLVRQSEHEHLLFLAPHHLVVDGFSWDVVEADLGALYRALASGQAPTFAPLTLQFHDFAFWQTTLEQRPIGRKQLAFWARAVAGYQGLELPGDLSSVPRGSVGLALDTYSRGVVPFVIEGPGWDAITQLCGRLSCTPYSIIATGFFLMLSRWSGSSDVCAMSSNFHRNRPGSEATVGDFVTPYPVRMWLDDRATLEETVRRCHDAVVGSREHQDVAPSSAAATWREWSRYNLNYLVDIQGDEVLDFGSAKLARLDWSVHERRTPHDLGLFVRQATSGIRGSLVYNAECFSPGLAARGAARLSALLCMITTTPSDRVSTLPQHP